MQKLSEHFTSRELECKCGCGKVASNLLLLKTLEILKSDLSLSLGTEVMLIITSGYRCEEYNKKVGGAKNSYHTKGLACDFIAVSASSGMQISPDVVADFLEAEYPDMFGIGRYPSWTHIDVRIKKARWSVK